MVCLPVHGCACTPMHLWVVIANTHVHVQFVYDCGSVNKLKHPHVSIYCAHCLLFQNTEALVNYVYALTWSRPWLSQKKN